MKTIASTKRGALLLKLHAEAAEWFHENLLKREVGAPAREYLKKRGINGEIAKSGRLGFAPESWDAFLKWARGAATRGRNSCRAASSSCATKKRPRAKVYDRFRGRLMFPICNDVGEVIAFSGRILDEDARRRNI